MKKIRMLEGIKPLCLIVTLLSSACHTAPLRSEINDVTNVGHVPADSLIKSMFPLGNYPLSVDKWLPPGPDMHVPIMDAAAQQRHFYDLKSSYFGMGADEKST